MSGLFLNAQKTSWSGTVCWWIPLAIGFTFLSFALLDCKNGICQETATSIQSPQPPDLTAEDASVADESGADSIQMKNRLVMVGLGVGTLLTLMGIVFFYLRLNHATRGFYNGRIQTLSIVGFVGILVVCYFLWRQILFQ